MSFPGSSGTGFAKKAAFTLLELLVVIGIISVLLVAAIPVVNSLGKSSGRKAAISSLVGAIEQARAEALRTREATYIVFPWFTSGGTQTTVERYSCRAYAIFVSDPANPGQPKQLTNWKTLPTGVSLRQTSMAALPLNSALSPAISITFSPEQSATPEFRCIQFNTQGAIESPTSDVTIVVFEGFVTSSGEVVTSSKDSSGNPAAVETVKVSHLTGRASYANL